ncbi:methionyl-tRNA formyltransferase [Kribbella shirazensis]|uniref:Methionyl-tRNA formyltransferase n=1 Tax=Kribbella shirazensis TaxID=1105143 RepID=A0A7X5V884_9ACTN|nr:formyltransferase family protein [Kribbella shirazensis]NIK56439.1 methionyl-tRNA formyltransferase [Kribbella shirazensis]
MSLRIVGLNAFLPGFRLVHEFAERNGHELALVVTLPQTTRYGAADPMVMGLPDDLNVLITRKLRTVAAPVIAAMQPDVVISAAFPRLIPREILDIPKYGAINCHPSPLPAGRGPTPQRLIYEGDERVAATVHRTAAEFDTGAILAQRIAPLPDDLNGTGLMESWRTLLSECLDEAVPRLVAGDPGDPQDPAAASEAPLFTDAERVLDLTERSRVIRRKAAALNVTAPSAQVHLDGATHLVTRTDLVDTDSTAAPGSVLEQHADGWTVQTADRPLRLTRG